MYFYAAFFSEEHVNLLCVIERTKKENTFSKISNITSKIKAAYIKKDINRIVIYLHKNKEINKIKANKQSLIMF